MVDYGEQGPPLTFDAKARTYFLGGKDAAKGNGFSPPDWAPVGSEEFTAYLEGWDAGGGKKTKAE